MTAADWIDDLERKAKAATPGPWSVDGYGSGQQVTGATGTIFADTRALHEDAEFIAAANPDTILRLIEDNRRLSSVIKGHEAIAAALISERDELAARLAAVEAAFENLPIFLSAIEKDQRRTPKGRGGEAHFIPATPGHGKSGCPGDNITRWLNEVRAALSAPTDTSKETDR